MRRPLLLNSALLLLALLLAGLVWLSAEQPEEQRTPLTTLAPEQITQIVIENSNGPAIRLERESNDWIMTQPSRAKADKAKIENLLEITRTKSIRRFEAPQDLTEFGLNPPQAVLTLNLTRIEMGGIHPMNQRRYMRVGNLIHLVNDRFPYHLQATSDYLIPATNP